MVESSSSSPVSSDVVVSCSPQTNPLQNVDPDLVRTLHRAATLVRSGATNLAEFEILHRLASVLDTDLTTFALDIIDHVRTLDLATLGAGPILPLDPDRVLTTSSPGRSGPRRDYAHAIVTALRIRLHAAHAGDCQEAA